MKVKIGVMSFLYMALLGAAGNAAAEEPIQPIAPVKDINLAKAELGKKLFFDPLFCRGFFF